MSPRNIIASVTDRLRKLANDRGEVFDRVLNRYALERILYRIGISKHADRFVLKGALLFYLWNEQLHRPTKDMDFLGFGPMESADLRGIIEEVLSDDSVIDGLAFQMDLISVEAIREDAVYSGLRIRFPVKLGNIRIPVQIDVGSGDAITPAAESKTFPVLLSEFPAPEIRSYPVYTVIAEKLEAIVTLGYANSRMKDYFDLHYILRTESPDPEQIINAVRRTFEARKTGIPTVRPAGLSDDFAKFKEDMWRGFLNRNKLSMEADFGEVVLFIREKLHLDWT